MGLVCEADTFHMPASRSTNANKSNVTQVLRLAVFVLCEGLLLASVLVRLPLLASLRDIVGLLTCWESKSTQ
jgi:hypothetical protein